MALCGGRGRSVTAFFRISGEEDRDCCLRNTKINELLRRVDYCLCGKINDVITLKIATMRKTNFPPQHLRTVRGSNYQTILHLMIRIHQARPVN
ncbi:hypothetical protein D7B51_22915 [Salmonella enterica]|nr:hypothetical protein [Salmonella enterica]